MEPMMLYKLMILYLLHQVNFPLTGSQISEFFLSHEYTNYFTLQQALAELIDAKLVGVEVIHNSSRYSETEEGAQTLGFFGKKISAEIVADMDAYLKENKFKLRSEVATTAEYYPSSGQDFIVHCEVREGRSVLISLDLSVPDEKTAGHMCDRWGGCNSDIYAFIMKELMGSGEAP